MATDTNPEYFKCPLKTPEEFIGTKPNSKILAIGGGQSTADILAYRDYLHEKFDAIICVNYTFQDFDSVSDFHITVERQKKTDPITVPGALNDGNYRSDIPRLINWQGYELYDPKYNLYKTTRSNFYFEPDIRKYKHNGSEGLLYWKQKSKGWSSGTAMLSAMHFAAMLGASEIYLIGCDLYFKDEFDHYYKDKIYRDPEFTKKVQPKHRMDIVDVQLENRIVTTTNLFRDAAETINEVIPSVFKGIKVYDFSNGLIKKAIKLDIDEFFKKGDIL